LKATTLLERQHRDLEQLCEAVECGSASVRASLLPQLAGDLAAHLAVEEQLLYPAARDALRDDDSLACVTGASVLSASAMQSLDRALDAALDGEEFSKAIGELRATVTKHAEQEEARIFRRLEGTLEPAAMRQLGASLMSLYDTKVEAGYTGEMQTHRR
jgi:hemerythrin superfamily protein